MVINNNIYNHLNRVSGKSNDNTVISKAKGNNQGSFDEILKGKINEASDLKFSKHAEMRLQTRNIHLSDAQKQRITQAVNRAEEKGVRDSLVMVDNIALVVNVKNRTVITAVNSNELKENVFTNIDGAVFT